MAEISPGQALRQLQQAQAGMRKAREALRLARTADSPSSLREQALEVGWESPDAHASDSGRHSSFRRDRTGADASPFRLSCMPLALLVRFAAARP